jgi:hypothetical protein
VAARRLRSATLTLLPVARLRQRTARAAVLSRVRVLARREEARSLEAALAQPLL